MALPGFIFGGDTGIKTPEDLARARAIAEALLMPQRPAQNVGEGLAVLGQAIRGRREMNAANRAQATGDASASSAIMSALGGGQFPAAPTGGGDAPSPASAPSADASAPGGDYFSAIRSAESGGSDSAKNPTSSATGRYQFTTGTWGDVAKAHPELGLTPDGRLDPAQQEKAIRAFTADNANVLSNAGIPTTGGNLYAAHFLGAGGATNVLTKPDNSPVSAYVGPEVVKANPFLARMSVGDFKQWAARHGGGAGPVQVASNDPSAGVAQALGGAAPQPAAPSPIAAALQLPQQGPIPQGRPDVAAALNGTPPSGPVPLPDAQFNNRFAGMPTIMGNGAGPVAPVGLPVSPMPQPGVDPTATAATAPAAPPLPTRQISPDPMGAQSGKPQGPGTPGEIRKGADGKTYQYAQTTGMAGATGDSGWIETSMAAPQGGPVPPQASPSAQGGPDMSQYPVIAGGTSDAVQPGNGTPSMQDLLKLASNPWAMQKYGPIIQTLLAQHMKQTDPAYALDIATKQAGLALDQKKLGGSFTGDSMDAQAWNILQTRDPSSKEYATAYAIVSQPKTQLVQTANGMVPVQVPPQLPAWLKAPGGADSPVPGPAAAAAPAPGAAPQGAGGPAVPGAAIPGTKQPATETQARNGAISRILLNEVPTLGKTFQALADPKGQLLNALPGGVGNPWQSEEYQRAATAVKTSIANVLYSLSGASSNPGEVMKQIEVLTPAFGDKPGTITDKLNRFKTYVRSIATESNDPELQKSIEGALSQMDGGAAPAAGGGKKVIDGYTIEEVQ